MNDEGDTPTIPEESIRQMLSRIRRSTQERVSISAIAVMRILAINGVLVQEWLRDEIESAAAKIISEALESYSQRHKKIIEDQAAETEEALSKANREVFRLRAAILDYIQHGDLERLVR